MADFLKFLGSVFGAEDDAKKPDLKALIKELGRIYPCEPGALYQAGNCVSGKYEVIGELGNLERDRYYHVFVSIDGRACDIKGFRSIDDMLSDFNEPGMIEEGADAQAIKDYFEPFYSREQLEAAKTVLRKAIV